MSIEAPTAGRNEGRFARDSLGGLNAGAAAQIVAAGGDVAMIIDQAGIIRDLALTNEELVRDGFSDWLDKRWSDTVTLDSRHKIEELLRDAANDAGPRWREVNHSTPKGAQIALRYIAVNSGADGRIIAIGRDQRATTDLQQRLVQAQQSMERDYVRLREAESRYRLLFQMASEAVMVVDMTAGKIVEANPAAERLVGGDAALLGQTFVSIFERGSRDAAVSLLALAQASSRGDAAQVTLKSKARAFTVAASLFRQERTSLFLVRLTPLDRVAASVPDSEQRLVNVMDRMPDAFVVTDENLTILSENSAFLDLTRLAGREQARGQSLKNFLGRAEVDRNILIASLREHGSIKNFATVLRNRLGEEENVEVSAVFVPGATDYYGFSIRAIARPTASEPRITGHLPRSVEQLSHLVGRVPMRELVRETTDLVERLCIEAALELTGNNRASAAEILGVSRQSLYSKLHRFGLGDLTSAEE